MSALVHHQAEGTTGKELHSLDHRLPMLLSLRRRGFLLGE